MSSTRPLRGRCRARAELRLWQSEDRRHWVIAHRSVSRPDEMSSRISAPFALTAPDNVQALDGTVFIPAGIPGPRTPRI